MTVHLSTTHQPPPPPSGNVMVRDINAIVLLAFPQEKLSHHTAGLTLRTVVTLISDPTVSSTAVDMMTTHTVRITSLTTIDTITVVWTDYNTDARTVHYNVALRVL